MRDEIGACQPPKCFSKKALVSPGEGDAASSSLRERPSPPPLPALQSPTPSATVANHICDEWAGQRDRHAEDRPKGIGRSSPGKNAGRKEALRSEISTSQKEGGRGGGVTTTPTRPRGSYRTPSHSVFDSRISLEWEPTDLCSRFVFKGEESSLFDSVSRTCPPTAKTFPRLPSERVRRKRKTKTATP